MKQPELRYIAIQFLATFGSNRTSMFGFVPHIQHERWDFVPAATPTRNAAGDLFESAAVSLSNTCISFIAHNTAFIVSNFRRPPTHNIGGPTSAVSGRGGCIAKKDGGADPVDGAAPAQLRARHRSM